jgi:hypothetical protein
VAFVFHEGERAVQRRAGGVGVADRVGRGIRPEIPDAAREFLADQPLVVLASRDPEGRLWASLLTGAPGFARATGVRTVELAARPAPGDPLAAALARGGAPVGMLAIESATRRRMRVNGHATVDGDRIVLTTDEVYANCPKYISRRDVVGFAAAAGPLARARTGTALDAAGRALVAATDTFFIATAHPRMGADASHRGGNPGFVTVHDAGHLSFPDYTGNSMYMTLGNLEAEPHAGLLVPDFDTGDLLLLSGTAVTDWSPERAAAIPGAHRVTDLAIERTVWLPGGSPVRWRLTERSRFNPPTARGATTL